MTDLRDLLDTVAGDPGVPTPDVIDGDARRGRRALVRRRGLRAGGVALVAAALAVGVAVLPGVGDDTPRNVVAAARPGPEAVPLVPSDHQVKGYPITSALAPEGWSSDVTDFVLAYSPPRITTSPDDFRHKLIVCLAPDTTPAPGAQDVAVGATTGSLWTDHGTTILVWKLADGRQADIQAPRSLHWDTPTLVRFAESVAFGAGAQVSRG